MKRLKYYIKEILSTIIIIVVLSNVVSYYKSIDLNKETFPLNNIALNNKPIMIHFWSTWCPICKIEAPNIQEISQNYKVLTIASQSGTNKDIINYLQENDVNFDFINDKDNKYTEQFNITVFPTTLIYDKNKKLVFSEVGYTSTFGLYIRMWWASL